jgi:hypothetical protein
VSSPYLDVLFLVHAGSKLAFRLQSRKHLSRTTADVKVGRVLLKWNYQLSVVWRGSGFRREEVLADAELESVSTGTPLIQVDRNKFKKSYNLNTIDVLLDLGVVLHGVGSRSAHCVISDELFLLSVPDFELPVRIDIHQSSYTIRFL